MRYEQWVRFFAHIRQAQSGSVGIIFGLTVVPLIFVVGVALDYSRASSAKAALDAVLDASVVSTISKNTNTFDAADAKAKAKAYFDAQSALIPGVTVNGFDLTVTPGSDSVTVTGSYTASVQTTLTRLMKFDQMELRGSSSGSRNFFRYMDFYILLDNSPSMGLGATTDDINLLQSVTSPGCAFACHQHTYSNHVVTGDDTNDNYHIAQRNKVTLRIDVLRTATQKLVDTAVAMTKLPQQYRMAIYTFSDVFQKISDLTPTLAQTRADATAIDLAYAYEDQRDTQTSYDVALPAINGIIPDGGDGVTPQTADKFLFLVTDGVQDEPVAGLPGKVGNVHGNRLINTIDPGLCKTMKDRGIKVAVLYTAYLPLPTNGFYNDWVAPIAPTIPTKLQACASPGLYFQVSVSGGIDQAMQQMFQAAVASVRLTN